MTNLELNISDINKHLEAVKQLIDFAGGQRVFLFDAPMGSGKTTFIKALCRYFGVTDAMGSPTYSIVNEYHTSTELKIFHFDLYRLKYREELFDIGFEEYVSSSHYTFIEWPELALDFLDSYIYITIRTESDNRYLYAKLISDS